MHHYVLCTDGILAQRQKLQTSMPFPRVQVIEECTMLWSETTRGMTRCSPTNGQSVIETPHPLLRTYYCTGPCINIDFLFSNFQHEIYQQNAFEVSGVHEELEPPLPHVLDMQIATEMEAYVKQGSGNTIPCGVKECLSGARWWSIAQDFRSNELMHVRTDIQSK